MAATPDGGGYWLVASDGGIFSYGDAVFHGSAGSLPLNKPIVGMAVTPSGNGYWLVASDGGIFSYGDAVFYGSTGSIHLNQPVVGMAAAPGGTGYWLVASDGGIFNYGTAPFLGSMGGTPLNAKIVGMAAGTGGYWMAAVDGGVFNFGTTFLGSMGGQPNANPIRAIAATHDGNGYWLLPTSPPPLPPTLNPGASGPAVAMLQQQLYALGTGSTPRTATSVTAPSRPCTRSRRRPGCPGTAWSAPRPGGARGAGTSAPKPVGLRHRDRLERRPDDVRNQREADYDLNTSTGGGYTYTTGGRPQSPTRRSACSTSPERSTGWSPAHWASCGGRSTFPAGSPSTATAVPPTPCPTAAPE